MQKETCDVAVIGGGIIGTSIAWRLAQAGVTVTILEAGNLGGEASWAGAGMLAPGGEIGRKTEWTDFALDSLGLYPAFAEELRAESDIAIDFQQLGAVELALTPAEWLELEARRVNQRAFGIDSEALEPSRLSQLLPLLSGPEPAGALFYPADSLVDPRHLIQALRIACTRRGVAIFEHRTVQEITLEQGGIEIDTISGATSAKYAVLAAGAWSGGIPVRRDGERILLPASFPVKGHLLGYCLEPDSMGPILRHGKTYIVQRSNGFTVAGSSMEQVGYERAIDRRVVEDIDSRAASLIPTVRRAPEPEAWVGFRPATAGFEPELRRYEDGRLWLSYGHFRNGILLAPATARRVAGEILHDSHLIR